VLARQLLLQLNRGWRRQLPGMHGSTGSLAATLSLAAARNNVGFYRSIPRLGTSATKTWNLERLEASPPERKGRPCGDGGTPEVCEAVFRGRIDFTGAKPAVDR
jgi:hypothetical protein